MRFSQLVVEQRWIKRDRHQPAAGLAGAAASPSTPASSSTTRSIADADLPRLAIRPYPRQYEQPWTAPDGASVLIRPIRPEDEPAMVQFHAELSEETVYSRYFEHLGLSERTAHERLTRICFNDYDREIALVAEETDVAGGPRIVAVGRLSKEHARPIAEFAVLVADRWQRRGLGAELLRRLVAVGRDEGLERLWAEMLAGNMAMRHTAEAAGFTIVEDAPASTVRAELTLTR